MRLRGKQTFSFLRPARIIDVRQPAAMDGNEVLARNRIGHGFAVLAGAWPALSHPWALSTDGENAFALLFFAR